MKALKRKEIIDCWVEYSPPTLDMFCCPACRNVLSKKENTNNLVCINEYCTYRKVFDNCTGEVIKEVEA